MIPFVNHMLVGQGNGTPPTPLTVTVSPASGTISGSGSATYTVSASGGTGPYTYSWSASASSGSASVSGSGSSVTVSWSSVPNGGTLTVTCLATDSLGATGSGVSYRDVPVPSGTPLGSISFSVSGSPYVQLGISYGPTVTANVSGGTAPLTYDFGVINFTSLVAADNQCVPYMGYADGTHVQNGGVFCRVTDATGASVSATLSGISIIW